MPVDATASPASQAHATHAMHDPDFDAIREAEFPELGDGIFLNAASYGPIPQRALSAVGDHDRRHASAQLTEADFAPPLAAARGAIADLIGAKTREIALAPNT